MPPAMRVVGDLLSSVHSLVDFAVFRLSGRVHPQAPCSLSRYCLALPVLYQPVIRQLPVSLIGDNANRARI